MSAASSDATASPSGVERQYYKNGETWEHDIARRNRYSRSLAWTVAAVMSLIALGSIGALLLALPLKTYEPYVIEVDRSSGFVDIKRPTAVGPLTQDEAITMFNIVRYVRARETYDPREVKDNFDLAQLLSTGKAAQSLRDLYEPSNPKNPQKIYKINTTVSVYIKSVTFPNKRTALVRFSTEERSNSNVKKENWLSVVRFQYSNAPMRNEYRFENPLGFQVTEYRRDQESVQADGSAAQ
ncbi:MAG: virB8 family protein [Methylobacterium sp.]|nr:virB8 family protein [Methylobacterium sp.]MBX9930047.1 virB8 family protein [Methylobacterium sp.]